MSSDVPVKPAKMFPIFERQRLRRSYLSLTCTYSTQNASCSVYIAEKGNTGQQENERKAYNSRSRLDEIEQREFLPSYPLSRATRA